MMREPGWLWIVLLAVGFAGCAGQQTPDGGPQPRSFGSEERARAERLERAMPSGIRALLKLRVDAVRQAADALPKEASGGNLREFASLEGFDEDAAIFLGVVPGVPPGWSQRIWTAAPLLGMREVPAGFLVRAVLPADDTERLREALGEYCTGGGYLCDRRLATGVAEGFVTVDLGFPIADRLQSGTRGPGGPAGRRHGSARRPPGRARLEALGENLQTRRQGTAARYFDRKTPALRALMRTECAFGVHVKTTGLWLLPVAFGDIEMRKALRYAAPENYHRMFLEGQVLARTGVLHDAAAAEFEDFALLVSEHRSTERESNEDDGGSPGGGSKRGTSDRSVAMRVDVFGTFTERGRKIYHTRKPPARLPVPSIDEPLFRLETRLPFDRWLTEARAPYWGDEPTDPERLRESLRASPWSVRFLEYPGGLFRMLVDLGEKRGGELLGEVLGSAQTDEPPSYRTLLAADRMSVAYRPGAAGSVDSGLGFGIALRWPETVFEPAEAWERRLTERLQDLSSAPDDLTVRIEEAAGGGQRLTVARGTSFPASADDVAGEPATMQIDLSQLLELAGSLGGLPRRLERSRLVEAMASASEELAVRAASSKTHLRIRAEVGRSGSVGVGSTGVRPAADFELDPGSRDWRDCMREVRIWAGEAFQALGNAAPENRRKIYEEFTERMRKQKTACADRYPEHQSVFRRAGGRWRAYEGVRYASAFTYDLARQRFAEACEVGVDAACEWNRRIESVVGYRALPRTPHPVSLVREAHNRLIVTDEGVFTPGEKLLDIEAIRGADTEAIRRAISTVRTQGNPRNDFYQIAADTLVDAESVVELAERSFDGRSKAKFWVNRDRRNFSVKVLNVIAASPKRGSTVRVHLGAEGIGVWENGDSIEPIDGCADDAPTVCRDSVGEESLRSLFSAAREPWSNGSIDRGYRKLDRAYAAFRLHELYGLLVEVKSRHPDETVIGVTVDSGIPYGLLVRLLSATSYRRKRDSYDTVEAFRSADIAESNGDERYRRRPAFLFSNPIVGTEIADQPSDDSGSLHRNLPEEKPVGTDE